MKLSMFFVAFINIFTLNKSLEINSKFAVDFLNYFNLNYGSVFYCDKLLNTNDWRNVMTKEFKYFSFIDISSSNFNLNESWTTMRFEYQQIGIIFDASCNETEEVFNEFSNHGYFNSSYLWLMLSEDYDNSIELLSTQNINFDAEITLAILTEDDIAKLYDAYNPSARTNGELMVQVKGCWSALNGLNINLTESKLSRRKNLQNVIIHAGIVAAQVAKNQTLMQHLESEKLFLFNKLFI